MIDLCQLMGKLYIFLKDVFGINKVGDLYDTDLKLIHLEKFVQLGLSSHYYYNWMQLVDSIPVSWKSEIIKSDNSPKDLSISKYTLYIQRATTVEILQLTCKGFIYEKFINQIQTKPTSQLYWQKMINEGQGETLDWKQIYKILRVDTIESYTRSFQYLIISNALFLNKKSFWACLLESAACTFCAQHEESPTHFSVNLT